MHLLNFSKIKQSTAEL